MGFDNTDNMAISVKNEGQLMMVAATDDTIAIKSL